MRKLAWLGALFWIAMAGAADPSPRPLPLDLFFGLPAVRQPRLSPDGSKIAFLFPHEGRMALGVFDRKENTARMIIRGREESLTGFFWKGDDRLVFYADYGGNESFFVATTDLTGKKVMRIVETQHTDFVQASAGSIHNSLPLAPEHITIAGIFRASNPLDPVSTTSDFVVARVNVHNRGLSVLYTYDRSDRPIEVLADNRGDVRLRSRFVPLKDRFECVWEHRRTNDSAWREIARQPYNSYAPDWQPLQFSADNRVFYLLSREEHDRGALYAYDTDTLTRGAALFVPPEGEINDLILSQDRTRLLGVSYESDRLHYHWFDQARAALQQQLENSFPGLEVRITSQSDDEQVCLVWVGSDREPGVYFVLDRKAGTMTAFKRIREIDPRQMQPMTPVKFTARDGLELHGYLTRPAGPADKRVPLIIHPHGGPFGVRDSWGFNPEVQFLANRGYAVLQVNYRGSGGYGREFLNRGRQQWGRAMQDDLTDAVKWAIAQGVADPERVAIYGASYGGYAALAGVTLTPELYRCAVNYVGAADLEITFKDLGEDAFRDASDYSYQREWVGATKAYRDATSPVNFIDRIRVPTLHAYGEKDPRVKIDHWSRLEPLLRKHGKTYVSIEEKNQGHGFRDEKSSVSFYAAMEKFLTQYLAPAGR